MPVRENTVQHKQVCGGKNVGDRGPIQPGVSVSDSNICRLANCYFYLAYIDCQEQMVRIIFILNDFN